jgi:predicted glycogen debranching enzyme
MEMNPPPGATVLRYVGDKIRFTLASSLEGDEAFLRTNIGRATLLQAEVVEEYWEELERWHVIPGEPRETKIPRGLAWRDIPMKRTTTGWELDLVLTEVGWFSAKAYLLDPNQRQVWPEGPNCGITVHPNELRTGNSIYCAFTRMFGETKSARINSRTQDSRLTALDDEGYAVIPPSGTLRDLKRELPHIFKTLGFRYLQLLPVNPTPTTYARFGRYGSPYASQDLTAIDPALVEFDRRTTGIDQFRELTDAAHQLGGRVLLDIVINHTGWGSREQQSHPEWFLRNPNGIFESPGAWGTTWEDLVEIDHRKPLPWDYLAEVFLTWCRRGVDGFRCDAGYKIPTNAWRYIVAKVRLEFPATIFLLEGLGGSWEATDDLLTRGGMQWAYSELFQNFSPHQVSGYLDHVFHQNNRVGTLIHFSETHDNDRLAKKGRLWSLMRNQLSALTSSSGGYAITCGVEWLATEKINVHNSSGMCWGNPDNLLPEIGRLNELLSTNPCFFDDAKLERLSPTDSSIYAIRRISADKTSQILILVNLDAQAAGTFALPQSYISNSEKPLLNILDGSQFFPTSIGQTLQFQLRPGESLCIELYQSPDKSSSANYSKYRAIHAWAINLLSHQLEPEQMANHGWLQLAQAVENNAYRFLAAIPYLDPKVADSDLPKALASALNVDGFPEVIKWSPADIHRVTLIPPGHSIYIQCEKAFRATLEWSGQFQHADSILANGSHIAAFWGRDGFDELRRGDGKITLHYFDGKPVEGAVRFLSEEPEYHEEWRTVLSGSDLKAPLVLLTNGIGGMARMCVDLGKVKSKYDCVLGANLHPEFPVDRHIFVKRIQIWANANGFISPLDRDALQHFQAGPPARWQFSVIAGDGRIARIQVTADMLYGSNTTVFRIEQVSGKQDCNVSATVRFGIEDRNFHNQTEYNGGTDHHFSNNIKTFQNGFEFQPASDRKLRVIASYGKFNPAPEWSFGLPHTVEQTRGQQGQGDAYSPGWFELPLNNPVLLMATAEDPAPEFPVHFEVARKTRNEEAIAKSTLTDKFGQQLALAAQAFVVRRNDIKTIIAGYPWFLDWGRDSLICARGLLAGGMHDEVLQLLIAFGRFEESGTLPNTIHGADASNRDTSDAPLWYGIVCEELAALAGTEIYDVQVTPGGRTIREVLFSIAEGYARGTPNRIHIDAESALVWSPSHFTWMDTNYPAGTPREGYPVEIQALWIRLLRQLAKIDNRDQPPHDWKTLATRAEQSLVQLFWIEEKGWLADVLLASNGVPARTATRDDALRSNCIIPLSFDLIPTEQGRRCLLAVQQHLVIPGALRSLAPLPVRVPLAIHGPDWRLLNNPDEPYWPHYEGDEDTRRKPAYHNGTAWTWTFPGFCEAIVHLWPNSPEALRAARAFLGSMSEILGSGCIGQIPEILDGNAPHTQRGCDAQSWGVTEALRVWKLLSLKSKP